MSPGDHGRASGALSPSAVQAALAEVPPAAQQLLLALTSRVETLERRVEEQRVKQPAKPPLMSVKDVAHYLGVSERTVRTLIADGELVPIRVGRQLRFDERTLDAYVRRRVER